MEGKTSMVDDLEKLLENIRNQIPGTIVSRRKEERKRNKRSARSIHFTFCFPQHKHAS
jgi:hypothetical protein